MNWGTRLAVGTLVLLGLMICKPAHALGLGEARVDSFLNQPLEVQIRLLDVSEADMDSLTARIGSSDDYERLGLMGDVLALDVSVSIDRSQSPPVLRVRSQRPVSDPIVQLLLDARWSSGRILREYTLFLDPPTITAAPPPRPVQQTEPEPVTPTRPDRSEAAAPRPATPSPSAESLPEPRPEPAARELNPAVGDGRYRVRRGDTLWSVAQRMRPDPQLSMSQTMLAIVDLNPLAFRDGSVHQMLSGVDLQLPDRDQIEAIDRQFAEQTVQQQNRAFNQRFNVPVTTVADANPVTLDTPQPVSDAQSGNEVESAAELAQEGTTDPESSQADDFRLELVPPVEGEDGLGLTAEAGEANRLRQQLARAEEELFTARLEAEQFQERLDELEAMVNDNPSGLGIRDLDLAQLEQTLRAARAATEDQADPALRAEVSDQLDSYLEQFAAAPAIEASDAFESEMPTQTSAQTVEEDRVDTEPQSSAEPVVTQVGEPRSGLSAWLGNPMMLLVLGLSLLLIVLLLVWLVVRRARALDSEEPLSVATRPEPAVTPSDPVAAARQRVQSDPDDLDARLSLLQALAGQNRTEDFSTELDAMYARVDRDEEPSWLEALTLAGNTVPDHALVLGSIDWVAGGSETRNTDSYSDGDHDVNELIARMQDEPDSSGMLTEDELQQQTQTDDVETTDGPLDTPFLHEVDQGDEWQPGVEEDTTDLGEPIESDSQPGDEAYDAGRPEIAEDEDEALAESSSEETDSATDQSEPLSLDWPEADQDDASVSEDLEVSEDPGASDDEDIFGTSDDDIDVKLDLARAYLSWNSIDSARTLLEEVVVEGNTDQREQAKKLLDDL